MLLLFSPKSCPNICKPVTSITLGFPVLHCFLQVPHIHVHWVGDAIQPSLPLSSSSLAFDLSQHQGLSDESILHIRWPKYWSFNFSICPSNEHSGLISFRIDWFDLRLVKETLESLLQHHTSKISISWPSTFFTVQLSRPYVTTGKTIALTRWTSVGKVMPLLFNMLSGFVLAFPPRSKCL